MNFLLGILVYLPAVLAGGLLIHQLWPGNQPARLFLKLGLGAGFGLGLTSLIAFVILLITDKPIGYLGVQLTMLAGGFLLAWYNRKNNPILPEKFSLTRIQKILLIIFGTVFLVSISAYFIQAVMTPNGRFDAWMIYNRAARFIYRGQSEWRNTLSPQMYWLFHADYPLLLPINVAGAWSILGGEVMRAPQAQSGYFLLSVICILMGATALIRNTSQALLAGAVFLGIPVFLYITSREEADVIVASYILATSTLLFLYHRERNPALIGLSGFFTGLAAWTKNEGLLFIVSSAAAWILLLQRMGQPRMLIKFALGLSLPLAIVVYFKVFLTPPNDLFVTTSSTSLFERLADPNRYYAIFNSFYDQIFAFGNGHISIIIPLLMYILIVKLDQSTTDNQPTNAILLMLFLQLAGYFLIYVLTPHNINWHLRTSLYRLLVHAFPSMLFLLFASVSEPESIFSK